MEKLYIEFDDISIGPITIEVEYFEEILPVFTWTNLLTGEIIKTNSPAISYSISNSKKIPCICQGVEHGYFIFKTHNFDKLLDYIEHLSCDNNSIKSKKDLINKSVFRNYHINNLFITDFEYPDTIKNNQLIEFKAIYRKLARKMVSL